MRKLSTREAAFVAEYLKDLQPRKAAVRAGYSKRSARVTAYKLLAKEHVKAAVDEGKKLRAQELHLEAVDVLRELMRVGFSDVAKVFDKEGRLRPIREIPLSARRSIASIEIDALFDDVADDDGGTRKMQVGTTTKVKFWDKPKALELMGKHLKLFTDKVEHSGKVGLEELINQSYQPDGEDKDG